MFEKGTSAPEVGRRLGVSRQVAYRWKAAWEKGGKAGLTSKGKAGRKSKLTALQTELVVKALVEGPVSRGYKTNLWTLPRVATLIKDLTGVQYHPAMSGDCWATTGSVANARSAARLSATSPRSAVGSGSSGRR